MSRADDILTLIDNGLQTSSEHGYSFDNGRCVRCQKAAPAESSAWCEGCRAFLLTEELDPEPSPERDLIVDTRDGGVLLIPCALVTEAELRTAMGFDDPYREGEDDMVDALRYMFERTPVALADPSPTCAEHTIARGTAVTAAVADVIAGRTVPAAHDALWSCPTVPYDSSVLRGIRGHRTTMVILDDPEPRP